MVGRFAPSPTGIMHWGNASTALVAWLQMRAEGGRMLLRMEDVDPQRSKPEYADGWRRDLLWLGLDWDEEVAPQSQRGPRYAEALANLAAQGLVFACRCTRRDMEDAVSAPHGSFMGSYPGTCADSRWPLDGPGARRLRIPQDFLGRDGAHLRDEPAAPGQLALNDAVVLRRADGANLRDEPAAPGRLALNDAVVLRRADGAWAYQLAVVVDDLDQGVTHVVRGRDLEDSAPLQQFLHRALGNARPPQVAHAPLWMGPDGHRLSKRHGSVGVRNSGLEAAQAVGLLAHGLGLRDRPDACTPAELIDDWRARGPATLACGEVAAASFLPLPL
ncbi:MAG: glutamate--tRNA ligase family protein [Bacteroidota bacterium]